MIVSKKLKDTKKNLADQELSTNGNAGHKSDQEDQASLLTPINTAFLPLL